MTYQTQAQADAYFTAQAIAPVGWDALSDTEKTVILGHASNRFEALPWPDRSQTMEERAADTVILGAYYEYVRWLAQNNIASTPTEEDAPPKGDYSSFADLPLPVRARLAAFFPATSETRKARAKILEFDGGEAEASSGTSTGGTGTPGVDETARAEIVTEREQRIAADEALGTRIDDITPSQGGGIDSTARQAAAAAAADAAAARAAIPGKASNNDVDGETDDADYMTVVKTFRAIARKVKQATTTVAGIGMIARNEDVDDTETDTSRLLDVLKGKRLVERVVPAWARQTNPPSSGGGSGRLLGAVRTSLADSRSTLNSAFPAAATGDLAIGYETETVRLFQAVVSIHPGGFRSVMWNVPVLWSRTQSTEDAMARAGVAANTALINAINTALARALKIVATVSPGHIDLTNIPDRYSLRLDVAANEFADVTKLRITFGGATQEQVVNVGGAVEILSEFTVTSAVRSTLEALAPGRVQTFTVSLLDASDVVQGDATATLEVIRSRAPTEHPSHARDFNSFLADPDKDCRIYALPNYTEVIPDRDALDGDYVLILKEPGNLGYGARGVDVARVTILARGADLSTTRVHQEDWTLLQSRRIIPFNISDAEEIGAAGKVQRNNNRNSYHFIAVFSDTDGRELYTTTAANLWLESGELERATSSDDPPAAGVTLEVMPVARVATLPENYGDFDFGYAAVIASRQHRGHTFYIQELVDNAALTIRLGSSSTLTWDRSARTLTANEGDFDPVILFTTGAGTGLSAADSAKLVGITVNDETAARTAADMALAGRIDALPTVAETTELILDNIDVVRVRPNYWSTENSDARDYFLHLHSGIVPAGTTQLRLLIHAIRATDIRYDAADEDYTFAFDAAAAQNINNQISRGSEETVLAELQFRDASGVIETRRFVLQVVAVAPTDAAEVAADLTTETTTRAAADTAIRASITALAARVTTLEAAPAPSGGGVETHFDQDTTAIPAALFQFYDLAEVTLTIPEGKKAILIGSMTMQSLDGSLGETGLLLRLTDGRTNYDDNFESTNNGVFSHEASIYRQITRAGDYTFKLQARAGRNTNRLRYLNRSLLALIV